MRIERIAYALLQIDRAAETLADEGETDSSDVLTEEARALRARYGFQGLSRGYLRDIADGLEDEVKWSHAVATRRGGGSVVVWDWYRNRADAVSDPRVREGHAEVIPRSELPDDYTSAVEGA